MMHDHANSAAVLRRLIGFTLCGVIAGILVSAFLIAPLLSARKTIMYEKIYASNVWFGLYFAVPVGAIVGLALGFVCLTRENKD